MPRGKMLKNGRAPKTHLVGNHYGCSCCNPKGRRKAGIKAARKDERRAWQRDQRG